MSLGAVSECICAEKQRRCRREEKKEVGRQRQEADSWKYSAVIHKVESTTKLLATV